jgi:hypothetical protein
VFLKGGRYLTRDERMQFNYDKCHKVIEEIVYKKCNICEEWFPCTEEYFYKSKCNKSDGLHPECKKCNIKKSNTWKSNNRERYLEIMREVNANEYAVIQRREWSRKNRENGQRTIWETNNPDKVQQYRQYRQMHKTHDITEKQWIACKNYFRNENGEWCCAYCGLPISQHLVKRKGKLINMDFHKEHVDDAGSNGLENCIPSCGLCNSSKRKNSFEEWYNPNNKKLKEGLYSEQRYKKIIIWLQEDHKRFLIE